MGSPQDDEHRIDQLLAEYLQREDAGEAMDRDAFLRRHPGAAKQLADLLTMGQLLALVARGGMGVVYKARQIKLNRVVALKFIMAGTLANQADVRRFYAEAQAAGKLDHPSIVPVFDVAVHQGQHYLVMAYVDGMSLAKRIVDGPLPPGEAAALMQKVAAAVAYAHEQGVVHRDLKPGNILVARDGTPRVTDFGLAKRIDEQSSLTATGQVLGTPSYMPPEQAEGRLDEVGPLSDVYALGATLWEIIRHPAAVESVVVSRNGRWLALAGADGTVRVLNMLTHTERFSAKVSDMPLWAVAFDPSSRSLAAAGKGPTIDLWKLREGGEPVHLQSSGGGTHSLAFDRRGLAAGGNDGVIRYWNLTGGGPTLQLREHSAAVTCLDFMYLPGTARMPRGTSLLISVDAQGNSHAWYSQGVSQAVAIPFASRVAFAAAGQGQGGGLFLTQGNQRALFGCMVQLVDRYVPKIVWKETTSREGDTERVQSTVQAYAGTAPRLVLAPRPILPTTGRTFSISPGGNWIATGNEAAVEVWSIATGKRVKRFTGHKDLVTATAWSPAASLLVSSSRDGSVRIWRLQPGVRRHAVPILAVAFAPAGSRFASADSSGLICVWTHPKGRVETSLSAEREVRAMAFGPRGHFLATIDGGKRLSLWDVEKGKLVESWLPGAGQLTCVAFAPNGRSLAAATTEGQIAIRPLEGKEKPVILKGHHGAVYSVAFRGDGGELVSAGADSVVRLWNTANWSVVESLEGHDAEILEVAYSPQGDQLASGDRDGAVLLWDLESGSRSGERAAEGRPIRSLCFSHDGARLFTTDSSDQVTVWDTQSQLVVLRLAGQADIRCAAISADGRMIAAGNRNGTVEVWETETADDALRQQFARAAGLLAERFAICQTMPIADFQNVAAALSDRGYRPTRLRPYQTPEGLSVAAVWTRDQREWRMVIDSGATALTAEHQKLSREGFVACDLAGYLYADQKAATAIRYAALWGKADGPAPPSRIDLGMTGSLTSLEKKRAASGLLPATCQEIIDAKGKRLTSLVWRGATSTAGRVHIERSKRAAMRRSGLTQLDVALTHHAGATTYVRLWREGG